MKFFGHNKIRNVVLIIWLSTHLLNKAPCQNRSNRCPLGSSLAFSYRVREREALCFRVACKFVGVYLVCFLLKLLNDRLKQDNHNSL